MAYTVEQAKHHITSKGFSHRAARAIVSKLGPAAVFEGAAPAQSNSGDAVAHVQSFGYSADAAAKIVKTVEPHIILAAKAVTASDAKKGHSLWDPPVAAATDDSPAS